MKPDINLAHDVFRRARHPLDPFFKPRSVAVIGATEAPGSVGRMRSISSRRRPATSISFEPTSGQIPR